VRTSPAQPVTGAHPNVTRPTPMDVHGVGSVQADDERTYARVDTTKNENTHASERTHDSVHVSARGACTRTITRKRTRSPEGQTQYICFLKQRHQRTAQARDEDPPVTVTSSLSPAARATDSPASSVAGSSPLDDCVYLTCRESVFDVERVLFWFATSKRQRFCLCSLV
jgi:type VI protein secretion system component VasA